MDKQKISEYQLDSYIAATQRYRWFVLGTVLISGLIICQLYVEQFSIQPFALERGIALRIMHDSQGRLKRQEDGFAKLLARSVAQPGEKSPVDQATAMEYANLKYRQARLENTLNDTKMGTLPLPFLGLPVPSNDYVPIMATILAVFCGAVWLSSRSIWAALDDGIKHFQDPNLFRKMARLHFTFTGATGLESQRWTAQTVQYGAIWLPLFALGLGIAIDLYPMTQPEIFGFVPKVFLLMRIVILVGLWIVILVAVLASTSVTRKIDRLVAIKECELASRT